LVRKKVKRGARWARCGAGAVFIVQKGWKTKDNETLRGRTLLDQWLRDREIRGTLTIKKRRRGDLERR
jgi:hypothetical protein